jgi:hypothetical protein
MNAVAIQHIWQAIQDSERSDDLSFIDALKRSLMPQPDRAGATDRVPITTAATEPLRTATLPLLSRP